jgi:hypothetical protein
MPYWPMATPSFARTTCSPGRVENISHLRSEPRFDFHEQDICRAFDFGKLDYIFHLASPASPVDYLEHAIETLQVGSIGTMNCLELAKKYGAKFLLASTSECYGDPLEHPQKESYWGNVNPIGPRSVYDESKRFAEAATMAYHRYHKVDTRIVRIFNTYGPRLQLNDGRVISNFMKQACWAKISRSTETARRLAVSVTSAMKLPESSRWPAPPSTHRRTLAIRVSSQFWSVPRSCWRSPGQAATFALSRCRRTIPSSAVPTSAKRKPGSVGNLRSTFELDCKCRWTTSARLCRAHAPARSWLYGFWKGRSFSCAVATFIFVITSGLQPARDLLFRCFSKLCSWRHHRRAQ